MNAAQRRRQRRSEGHTARAVAALQDIEARGFTVRLVSFGEDGRTPGLPGTIRGVTDRDAHEVKVAMRPHETLADLAATLEHEARHVIDPSWDCGNRDVFGRGGPERGVS